MNSVSRDQKLLLTAQVRSRYSKMQADLSDREQILYGRISGRNALQQTAGETEASAPHSGLKVRFLIAILLFCAFLVLDRNHLNVAGITAEDFCQAISVDYEAAAEEWIETMTSQLSEPST